MPYWCLIGDIAPAKIGLRSEYFLKNISGDSPSPENFPESVSFILLSHRICLTLPTSGGYPIEPRLLLAQ